MQSMLTRVVSVALASAVLAACGSDSQPTEPNAVPLDPMTAPKVAIDRFSTNAAKLFVRTATNGFPAANAPIDMDTGPFITSGFGPAGQHVRYYNFDVQPTTPASLYVLFRDGESSPVAGQLDIVDAIPGQQGYSDFWRIIRVTVPKSYVANTIASYEDIQKRGFAIEPTTSLINAPIVPEGSTARLGGGTHGLARWWYRNQTVAYFIFDEAGLTATAHGLVPVEPIFVSFTANPGQPNGGSEFKTEPGSLQTHNVAASVPGQAGYTPLWSVIPFDNSAFATVHDLMSALDAPKFSAVGNVNCPIVEVKP